MVGGSPFFLLLHHSIDDTIHHFFAAGQEDAGHRPHQSGADDRPDSHGSAHEKSGCHKADIHDDTGHAEWPVQLVADHDCHQVIGAYPGVGFHYDGHAECQDSAAGRQNQYPHCKRIAGMDEPAQKQGEKINDGSAADHAQDRADLDIAAVSDQQDQDDQKTDRHMYPAVCKQRPSRHMLRRPEQALDQHVERIRAQVGQEEQGDAQMGDGQSDE